MLKAIQRGDPERAQAIRKALRQRLSREDSEYMAWQEWKEGLARYLENVIAVRFGLPENKGGLTTPFTRVTFYAGGEALIRMLVKQDPTAAADIEALFHRIAN